MKENLVLIEPYWNVNLVALLILDSQIMVLIEPYWNVNHFHPCTCLSIITVLIEPYWNVNDKTTLDFGATVSY